jgi:REP element-mobilizing transposase RayT
MPVKQTIPYNSGIFFITFTCHQWLPLIAKTNGYDFVYNWLDHLKSKGHFINGYVIMPNHVHAVISFINTGQSINTIVGNGKRFMAYEIIARLTENGETEILQQLSDNIEINRKVNNKQHNVWELSFDWKECRTPAFTCQKLDYIHMNPCVGKWNLANAPVDYQHSSAQFYITGEQGLYTVTNFMEMDDVDFKDSGQ